MSRSAVFEAAWRTRAPSSGLRQPESVTVGGKGRGLLSLPDDWSPNSLFLAHQFHSKARDLHYSRDSIHEWFPAEAESERAVAELGRGELLVRSDSLVETIAERGKFASVVSAGNCNDLERAVLQVWQHADEIDPVAQVGVIVQPLLVRRAWGHISNEQRLNREVDSWTVELHFGSSAVIEQWRAAERLAAKAEPLYCQTNRALKTRLRSVAAHFSAFAPRHHLEWVWDGSRLWIVQADPVPPNFDPPPGELWRPRLGAPLEGTVSTWRKLTREVVAELSAWPKIRALNDFAKSDLDTYPIWCMTDIDWVRSPDADEVYLRDLETLMSGHTVIRTDVAADDARFMLPKTTALLGASEALEFMRKALVEIESKMEKPRVAFLAHRFLRARSAAWSYSVPGTSIVSVDATWGLADGLGWLPHDKFSVDIRSGVVRRSIEGKTSLLDVSPRSSWVYRDTPSDWIWRASLTDSQALDIARGSWRLANNAGSPRLIMWFAGLLDGRREQCLPWFQAGHQVPLDADPEQAKGKKRFVIRDRSDLDSWLGSAVEGQQVLVLRPNDDLLRDAAFVKDLAASGRLSDALIEIDGSPLAHPYYMLTQAGATVVCPKPTSIDSTFDKLVRDKIPDRIQAAGEFVQVESYAGEALIELVRRKLIEEAYEVAGASSNAELIDELADLAEVARALLQLTHNSQLEVERARRRKLEARGGFIFGRYLQRTSSQDFQTAGQATLPGVAASTFSLEIPVTASGDHIAIDLEKLPIIGEQEATVHLEELDLSLVFHLRPREIVIDLDPLPATERESSAAAQELLF